MKSEFAPAKVNLFLHVGAARADGFHPIGSLMAFADVGDRLTAEPFERFALTVEGPTRTHAPAGEENLVLRAARALFEAARVQPPAVRLILDKQLPAEAGLGGGSSDAAAALRLLRSVLDLGVSDGALLAIAAGLGSDIPACVVGRPVIAQGRGEQLSPAPDLPDLPAVLVRPPVASATGPVYRAFDSDSSATGSAALPDLPRSFASPEAVAAFLANCRNDLEAPAVGLQPVIGEALDVLKAAPEALLARMSGSGSACFALCADAAAAGRLATRLLAEQPHWWVRACVLTGGEAVAPK